MTKSIGVKRKPSGVSGKVEDLPMLDRLRLLSREAEPVTTPPRTDSLLQLLMQGLHNRDERILGSVLDRADEEIIDKTVRKLPVEGVVPLVEELHKHLKVVYITTNDRNDVTFTLAFRGEAWSTRLMPNGCARFCSIIPLT